MTKPTIRPLLERDRPEWARLWSAYLAFYDTVLDKDIYDLTFTRLLSSTEGMPNAFVAERPETQKLCGLAHYFYHVHCWKLAPVCYLQDLFVDMDCRREGLGRTLMEAVFAEADLAGASNVYWLTQEFNSTARRLYDQVGTCTPFIKYQR